MMTMEFFTSTLVYAFIVLTVKHKGRLAKEWENYKGRAKVVRIAKKYLDWLKQLYPGKVIGCSFGIILRRSA